MKRRLKEPFGKAGLTVAILALVMALVGGAYAAGALSGKQKKEVEKIAKKYAGKPGATGANGTNGAAGKDGAPGAGAAGTPGKSVVASAAAVPGECPTGTTGTKFEVEGSGAASHVCNGKNGTNGTTGFTSTLPSGQTETGYAAAAEKTPSKEALLVPISFPIPLSEPIVENVHYVHTNGSASTECPGTAKEPQAAPGNLCVYGGYVENVMQEIEHAGAEGGPPVIVPFLPAIFEVLLEGKPQSTLTAGAEMYMYPGEDSQPPHEPEALPHSFEGTFAVTAP